ncbi:TspO/MBR family protein [Maribellus sp. YY47]|uniref:TspO/MBR family protein n=1 Tax=Maribellus sp. YY47 TaxID=2929486 RepID=UPI0020008DFB|nr:TspO/MBR family protein [Maribellus sp. YY47]MCK3685079.1 tryptophan-rich sensory protein [Maribellus sp. YY47]
MQKIASINLLVIAGIFLIINFSALGLGSYLMYNGPGSDWYQNLNKAPWTPPGWVFGAAWTSIMICFSVFMAFLWKHEANKSMLIALFVLQLVLNISWSPVFFYFHFVLSALIIIVALTLLIGFFLFKYMGGLNWKSVFVVPYFVWLLLASSLNAYILANN